MPPQKHIIGSIKCPCQGTFTVAQVIRAWTKVQVWSYTFFWESTTKYRPIPRLFVIWTRDFMIFYTALTSPTVVPIASKVYDMEMAVHRACTACGTVPHRRVKVRLLELKARRNLIIRQGARFGDCILFAGKEQLFVTSN